MKESEFMKEFIKELIPYIIIIVVIVLVRSFLITPVIVKGSSMEPTLNENEILFLSKISYKVHDIERFDIVVVDTKGELIIKRVIGLPGEKVEYKNDKLYINDEEVEDPYPKNQTTDFDLEDICNIRHDNCTTIIPDDKYLVLGDNRGVSADSRSKGLFNLEEIEGKVVFRLWPITKLGTIKK